MPKHKYFDAVTAASARDHASPGASLPPFVFESIAKRGPGAALSNLALRLGLQPVYACCGSTQGLSQGWQLLSSHCGILPLTASCLEEQWQLC